MTLVTSDFFTKLSIITIKGGEGLSLWRFVFRDSKTKARQHPEKTTSDSFLAIQTNPALAYLAKKESDVVFHLEPLE